MSSASSPKELYQNVELRAIEVVRETYIQAANIAKEDDAFTTKFKATLQATTKLVEELNSREKKMEPSYKTHWHAEVLYTLSIAHVCCNQIIQLIGGPDSQNLPEFSLQQLMSLLAWIEFFREIIEQKFPSIVAMDDTKKIHFDQRPDSDFFADTNSRSVVLVSMVVNNGTDIDIDIDIEVAMKNLAWEKNMLWEVHRLAQNEFLLQTRDQADRWIANVYDSTHQTSQTAEGQIVTSLCEDIFSLAGIQVRIICEGLSKKLQSDTLVMAVCVILSRLRAHHLNARDKMLMDLETSCAAANDFQRMSDRTEALVQAVIDQSELPQNSVAILEESCDMLISVYSTDSVFAAQKSHEYIFQPITEAISGNLFEPHWEVELTHNELAMILTRTLDDFISDLEIFLNSFVLKKAIDALVTATVVFYVKCLLKKANKKRKNSKVPHFNNTDVALHRMSGDIAVMQEYFNGLAQDLPILTNVIVEEFSILIIIQELLKIANRGVSKNLVKFREFIILFHKRIKDFDNTKRVIRDLWRLVQPKDEKKVQALMERLKAPLNSMYPVNAHTNNAIYSDTFKGECEDRTISAVPGLHLDAMVATFYLQLKQNRHPNKIRHLSSSVRKKWRSVFRDRRNRSKKQRNNSIRVK